MNGYLKIQEGAKKWGISERRINALCLGVRLEGLSNLEIYGPYLMILKN